MVSRTAKYALQILGYLASQNGTLVPGEEIARRTGIPANYLSKVLNQLRKQGIVDAEKGWGGGFALRKDARKRPIGDILAIIDGHEAVHAKTCLFGLPDCDPENPCPLHPFWERIRGTYVEMLARTTVQDLGT
jgi:Rrf2 family protein